MLYDAYLRRLRVLTNHRSQLALRLKQAMQMLAKQPAVQQQVPGLVLFNEVFSMLT